MLRASEIKRSASEPKLIPCPQHLEQPEANADQLGPSIQIPNQPIRPHPRQLTPAARNHYGHLATVTSTARPPAKGALIQIPFVTHRGLRPSALAGQGYLSVAQQRLYFLPLPHGQGPLRLGAEGGDSGSGCAGAGTGFGAPIHRLRSSASSSAISRRQTSA